MNEIKIWNYDHSEIRTIEKDGEPWWVLSDVCKVLELSNPSKVAQRLDKDERSNFELGRQGTAIIINESGLYSVILRSDKPEAKPFRKWVTSEVLPSIRKHGAYMTEKTLEQAIADPDFLIRLATELKNEQVKRKELETKVAEDKPKVLFADAVETAQTSILVGDLAKLIKQNGIDIGQKRLFAYLRENGYLIKNGGSKNMPTQKSMEMNLFEVKERTINNPDGKVRITKTTKVTGKGQTYFINKFLGDKSA